MIQKVISLVIVLIFLVSCEKELDIREFPIITTLNPMNIDETGATFRGELIQEGKHKSTSYGFTWSINESNTRTSGKIVLGDELSEGIFETRIDSLLLKGFEYKIRAFATFTDKTVYGNTITFMSRGSEKSLWSKELWDISLGAWCSPYGWSDKENAYVIFQDATVYRFEVEKGQFSPVASFPKSGNSGAGYTSIGINNIQYVFSDIDDNLYQFKDGVWSFKSNTPFNYRNYDGYYHGYSDSNQIYLLSSTHTFSYNFESNLWQPRKALPAENFSIGGTDLNGFAYVMDAGKNITRYNPQEDSWQYITTFPGSFPEGSVFSNRFAGKIIGFSHDNSIYFGFSHYFGHGGYEYAADIEESIWGFNLSTKSWKEIIAFPKDLVSGDIFYFTLKGKLYIGYGRSGKYVVYSLDTSKL